MLNSPQRSHHVPGSSDSSRLRIATADSPGAALSPSGPARPGPALRLRCLPRSEGPRFLKPPSAFSSWTLNPRRCGLRRLALERRKSPDTCGKRSAQQSASTERPARAGSCGTRPRSGSSRPRAAPKPLPCRPLRARAGPDAGRPARQVLRASPPPLRGPGALRSLSSTHRRRGAAGAGRARPAAPAPRLRSPPSSAAPAPARTRAGAAGRPGAAPWPPRARARRVPLPHGLRRATAAGRPGS